MNALNRARLNRLDALLGYLIDHPETVVGTFGLIDPTKPTADWPLGPRVTGFDLDCFSHETECGTTACAFGWAGLERGFRAEGLSLALNVHDGLGMVFFVPPSGGCYSAFDAAEQFFGLAEAQSDAIFLPHAGYATAADVRARLRERFATDPTGVEPPIQF